MISPFMVDCGWEVTLLPPSKLLGMAPRLCQPHRVCREGEWRGVRRLCGILLADRPIASQAANRADRGYQVLSCNSEPVTASLHMAGWFDTVTDLKRQAALVRQRPYGLIEVTEGKFVRIQLRPLPKSVSVAGIAFGRWWWHSLIESDSCWLYYNQPRRFPNFLALKYVVSAAGTQFATFRRAVALLDEVARIKRTDALLCDVSNVRISDRLLRRWGWEPHKPQRWHRNYIKRFYGVYPRQRASHRPQLAAVAGVSRGEVPVHG